MSYPVKYIPPHLRRNQLPNSHNDTSRQLQSASAPACPPSGKYTHTDLLRIFNTPHICSLAFFTLPSSDSTSSDSYNKKKDRPKFQYSHDNGKLMKIVEYPPNDHPLNHMINFIVVFEGFHPDWPDKNELWLHTHSKELIEDYGKDKKNFGRPLPVFSGKGKEGEFEFLGWWILELKEVVMPHSSRLRNMLQTKEEIKSYGHHGKKGRWLIGPLSYTWLILKLIPVENRTLKLSRDMSKGEGSRYTLGLGGLAEEIGILSQLERIAV